MLLKPRKRGPALELVDARGFRAPAATIAMTATPTGFRIPIPSRPNPTEFTPELRNSLALALHERWHGTHRAGMAPAMELVCAERASTFDDVAVIEPVILAWLGSIS